MIQRCALVVAVAFGCFVATMAQAEDRPVKLVVLGDSLSAGYGLPASAAFPARLEQALRVKGLKVSVANAGVSGDTASDGCLEIKMFRNLEFRQRP